MVKSKAIVLLSGGVDSSIVVALMAQESGKQIKTFSVGFGEKTHDERDYSRMVAQRYGTDHYEMEVTPERYAAELAPANGIIPGKRPLVGCNGRRPSSAPEYVWPDSPPRDLGAETPGPTWGQAKERFARGLSHEDAHQDQIRRVLEQARAAR